MYDFLRLLKSAELFLGGILMKLQHRMMGYSTVRLGGVLVAVGLFSTGVALAAHVDWDGGTASINTITGGVAGTAANWGTSGGGANGVLGSAPGVPDDVFLNDVVSSSAIARTVTVSANTAWQSLTINQSTAPSSGTNLNILAFGNFILSLGGSTPITLSGAPNAFAKLDISGASTLNLTNAGTKTVTFGPYSMLIGNPNGSGQGVYNTTAGAATFNLNGVTIVPSALGVNIGGGGSVSIQNNIVNITQGFGDSAGLLKLIKVSDVNLNWTGTINMAGTLAQRDGTSGSGVTIGSSVTGLSGGSILAGRGSATAMPFAKNYFGNPNQFGSVTNAIFAAGGTGFTLSGGVLDLRSGPANLGAIQQNLNPITVSGGLLAANSMAADNGLIRLSGGELALANLNLAAVSYTISTTPGANNRTIEIHSGESAIFSVRNGAANSVIDIPAQSDGGTWSLGTINADTNMKITNGFLSSYATYTVADNSGLNGMVIGASNALPATLTLGSNSSFFVSACTPVNRTYNIGVGGGNDIKVPAVGGFAFGFNNTLATRTSIFNLNRDKGDDSLTLVNNGASTTNSVIITTSQTGAGNLFINAKNITIPEGVTFSGTGGISHIDTAGYGFGSDNQPGSGLPSRLANEAGGVNGASGVGCTFTLNGSMTGTNMVWLWGGNSTIILGTNAVLSGSLTFCPNAGSGTAISLINQMTNGVSWPSGGHSLSLGGNGCTIEAATSTANPSGASNFKFSRISLYSSGAVGGLMGRFLNTVQNDGGAPGTKEAVYAGGWSASSATDSAGGHFLVDLNGQDLYVDRFTNMVGFLAKSIQLGNSILNSTSVVRALVTSGDTFAGGSFMIANNATIEVVGGNWHDAIYNRFGAGEGPGDNAAAPNCVLGINVLATRRWDGAPSIALSSAYHFLGSGADKAGNAGTAYTNTPGTLRIVGGDYVTSGHILSPLGVTGTIDTVSSNPDYTDTAFNTVMIRPNAIQAITNISIISGVMQAPGHRFIAGSPVQITAASGPGGLTVNNSTYSYYVVDPTPTSFKISTVPGGTALVPTTQGTTVAAVDPNGFADRTALPGLTVAGFTMINGHLTLPVVGGALASGVGGNLSAPVFQATLRVGGVTPVRTADTVDFSLDTLTMASGSVTNGQPVFLTGTTVPGGLGATFGQVLYARDVAGSTFKVAALPSQPAIDITSAGVNVTNVLPQATNAATLVVTGDLTTEARSIIGYIGTSALITITSINGDGATVTVTNNTSHGLAPGDTIVVSGGNAAFNGTFTVANVLGPTIFTYAAAASGAGGASAAISYTKTVSVNVAIQSNATVKVGGNVAIGGVGLPQNNLVTGLGVGIDPASTFILNGGLAVTQAVAIVPPVGCFHVGEGTNGVLTGTAAQALLATNLTVAGSLDVNGASVITGTVTGAGIILTNGADLVIGTNASIAIAGAFIAGSGSVVDLSAGTLSVGAFDLSGGGLIDLKNRADIDDRLRVKGNVIASLQAAIDAGSIRHTSKPLSASYNEALDYTTVRSSGRGTRLEIY